MKRNRFVLGVALVTLLSGISFSLNEESAKAAQAPISFAAHKQGKKHSHKKATKHNYNISAAIQTALNQINKERNDRGISDLSTNPVLENVASQRARQISTNFSQYDGSISIYAQVMKERGYNSNFSGENIGKISLTKSLNQTVLKNIHEIMYNDAQSNWSHRANFLNYQFNYIGIGIHVAKNGKVYIAYDLGDQGE